MGEEVLKGWSRCKLLTFPQAAAGFLNWWFRPSADTQWPNLSVARQAAAGLYSNWRVQPALLHPDAVCAWFCAALAVHNRRAHGRDKHYTILCLLLAAGAGERVSPTMVTATT